MFSLSNTGHLEQTILVQLQHHELSHIWSQLSLNPMPFASSTSMCAGHVVALGSLLV